MYMASSRWAWVIAAICVGSRELRSCSPRDAAMTVAVVDEIPFVVKIAL